MVTPRKKITIQRIFEQGPDAISLYSDLAQVIMPENEIFVQFYETIPGPPEPSSGRIEKVTSRLRVTIVLSLPHARVLGDLLLRQAGASSEEAETPQGGEQS